MPKKTHSPKALQNLEKLDVIGTNRTSRDGPTQKHVLIVWDIENATVPVKVPVDEVVRAISNAFQGMPRRESRGFCCSVSRSSLKALDTQYSTESIDFMLREMKVILAPGGAKSDSTDAKVIKEIDGFISRQREAGTARSSVLVVITGDDDFTESIKNAMDAGMDVELLHPPDGTNRKLLEAIRGRENCWHHDWLEFLEYWLRKHHKSANLPPKLELPSRQQRQQQQQQQQQKQKQQKQQQQQQYLQQPREGEGQGAAPAVGSGPVQARPLVVASLHLAKLPLIKGFPHLKRVLGLLCADMCYRVEVTPDQDEGAVITCLGDGDQYQAIKRVLQARELICSSLMESLLRFNAKESFPPTMSWEWQQQLRSARQTKDLSCDELKVFLKDKNVDVEETYRSAQLSHLVRLANVVLWAEAELELPYSTLPAMSAGEASAGASGSGVGPLRNVLVPVETDPPAVLPLEEEQKTVQNFLHRALTISQLKEKLKARGVGIEGLLEKGDLARKLCQALSMWKVEVKVV